MSLVKRYFAVSLTFLFVLSAGVSAAQHSHDHGPPAVSSRDDQKLKEELKGTSAKEAMDIANQSRLKKMDVVSFVTPEAVHFQFKDKTEISIPLPKDQMVVSIAPYIHKTHPCSVHHMSSCDAELKNTPVKVKAVNASGKVLIDQTFKSPTGFIDLWLPRDQEITLFVGAEGKQAKGKIFTYKDSNTCDSTLKLE